MSVDMSIHRAVYLPPHIPTNVSLSQFLNTYNPDLVLGEKVILEDDWTGKTVTYCGIRESAARLALGLKLKLGLAVGDAVAICGPNSVDYVQLVHAVLWAGGIATFLSTLGTVDDVVHCLEICRPKVVVVDSSLMGKVKTALGKISNIGAVKMVTLGGEGLQEMLQYPCDFEGHEKSPVHDLSNDDNREVTAVVCFSSGTSGKPKGVELSHHNLIASLVSLRSSDPFFFNSKSRSVFFAPICHIFGLHTLAILTPFLGMYTMVMKSFVLDDFLHLCSKTRANTMRIFPTTALAISKMPRFDGFCLEDVRYILCSGAPLQNDVIRALHEKLNAAPIFQGYGMTEFIASAILRPQEAHKVGSVGRLIAGVEARIVDPEMKDVRPGQAGEFLIRGPTVFRRYMNNAEETKGAFYEGWMRTGDIVRVDGEGFFYLIERKKEMIKYNGRQVAPAEIEDVLVSHPFVAEGTVCAKWNEVRGTEVPIAYIKLSESGKTYQDGIGAALEVVKDFVDARVAPYKRLRGGVEILDEIPKTASGKVLKRLLPARLEMQRRSKV